MTFEVNKVGMSAPIGPTKLDITKHSKHYVIVKAASYLELRDKYPDAFCIQKSRNGYRALWPKKGVWPNLITGDIEDEFKIKRHLLSPMLQEQAS